MPSVILKLKYLFLIVIICSGCNSKVNFVKNEIDDSFITDTLFISISEHEYKNIQANRMGALNDKFIKAKFKKKVEVKITYQGVESESSSLKIKGNWPDHIQDSVRFSVKVYQNDLNSLAPVFAIQQPEVRNGLYELVYLKLLKHYGFNTVNYQYLPVQWKIIGNDITHVLNIGWMVMEDDVLNIGRRENGMVFKPKEDGYFEMLTDSTLNHTAEFIDSVFIRNVSYKTKKNIDNKVFKKQFVRGSKFLKSRIVNGIERQDENYYFDEEHIAQFTAIANLCGASHNLRWHNLAFVLNNKIFDPIGFDGNAGQYFNKITLIPYLPFKIDSIAVNELMLGKFGEELLDLAKLYTFEVTERVKELGIEEGINRYFVERNRELLKSKK
jgi:hypothetical protein